MLDMKWFLGAIGILLLMASVVGCQTSDAGPESAAAALEPVELPRYGPGTRYETVTLPTGDTLRYTLFVPPAYNGTDPVPLVVALHYGGNVEPFYGGGMLDSLIKPGLGRLGAILVAPDVLGRGDWTTRTNEQAVVWLTRSILRSYTVDPSQVAITGHSMGGEGAWHIGGRHQDLFRAAVPIEGDPAGKGLEWTIPVYVIHSRDDEVVRLGPVEKHVKQLKGQGALVKLRIVDGPTHYEVEGFAGPLQEVVPWLKGMWNQ
jgi:predicted peptidase